VPLSDNHRQRRKPKDRRAAPLAQGLRHEGLTNALVHSDLSVAKCEENSNSIGDVFGSIPVGVDDLSLDIPGVGLWIRVVA